MEFGDTEEIEHPKNQNQRVAPPFAIVAVRSIARQALVTKNSTRGITMKAGNYISFAAGKVLTQIVTEATEQAKKTEANTLTKAQIIDVCLRNPKFRFVVTLLKSHETHQYFTRPTELSRRIYNSFINTSIPLAVSFIAPNPPGRSGNSEDEALFREFENTSQIFTALSQSVSAYMNHVPSFFKIQKD